MSPSEPRLGLATAPFLKSGLSTRRLMWEVVAASLLVVASACFRFGLVALLVVLAATAGAIAAEWLFVADRSRRVPLGDGSALLTGILLALTLPPGVPLWIAFVGGAVGVGLGKAVWGGLGMNLFNPALVGRAFLQAAFPAVLTTWSPPAEGVLSMRASSFALPFARPAVDAVTTATPLGLAKFERQWTELGPLLTGNIAGSLGETSAVLLIACLLWLGLRRVFDWRLPAATLLAVAVASQALHMVDATRYPDAAFMICSGGLLFGAVFMVTDPVTSPITPRGAWIFGIGVGLLVVLIRLYGGLPEGVMYAILLMNSVTPLINRFTQPRRFGG